MSEPVSELERNDIGALGINVSRCPRMDLKEIVYLMTAFRILVWNFLLTAGPMISKKCLV